MRVWIHNFRCYRGCHVFEFGDGALSRLHGASGSGKSTVFMAINWCIHGGLRGNALKPSAESAVGNAPRGILDEFSVGSSTAIVIEFADGVACRRGVATSPLEVRVDGRAIRGNDAVAWAVERFGTRAMWLASSYVPQGNRNPLLSCSSAEKFSILYEVAFGSSLTASEKPDADTTSPAPFLDALRERSAALKSKLAIAAAKVASARDARNRQPREAAPKAEPPAVAGIPDDIDALRAALPRVVEAEKAYDVYTGLLPVITAHREAAGDEGEYRALSAKVEAETKRQRAADAEATAASRRLAEARARADVCGNASVRKAVLELRRVIRSSADSHDIAERLVAMTPLAAKAVPSGGTGCEILDSVFTCLRAHVCDLDTERRKSEALLKKQLALLKTHAKRRDGAKIENSSLQEVIDAADVAIAASKTASTEADCPRCGETVQFSVVHSRVSGSAYEFKDAVKARDAARSAKKHSEDLACLEDPESIESDIGARRAIADEDAYRRFIRSMALSLGEVQSISDRIFTHASNANESLECEIPIKAILAPIDSAPTEEEIFALEKAAEEASANARAAAERLVGVRDTFQAMENARTQLRRMLADPHLRTSLGVDGVVPTKPVCTSKQVSARYAWLQATREISASAHAEKDLEDARRAETDIAKELENTGEAIKLVSRVAMETISDTVRNINTACNSVLSHLFDEPISMCIELTDNARTAASMAFGAGSAAALTVNHRGSSFDPSLLSGGEADRLSLALTIAIASATRSPIVLLDETLSSLDYEMRERSLAACRQCLADVGKTVVIVDHGCGSGSFDAVVAVG